MLSIASAFLLNVLINLMANIAQFIVMAAHTEPQFCSLMIIYDRRADMLRYATLCIYLWFYNLGRRFYAYYWHEFRDMLVRD
ncbi:conserved hypothetical protein [Trichinella spiralis]|uniref:hypothetical protein n=1 Tax=Trichinella spiralis TaxID=6334 RepID=UPI0001EFD97D|nr:conserved hypothetical protein [Trichinella spiralis]